MHKDQPRLRPLLCRSSTGSTLPTSGLGNRAAALATSQAYWRKPLGWNKQAEATHTRPFVFCASLADVFDNEVEESWRADLFELVERTPQLVWLLLTKRIGNVIRMVDHGLPKNVAIGATMANQAEYDRDSVKLAEVNSRFTPMFTFGSFEPLLGPVALDVRAPDWIIVGGESGRGARPMNFDWARSLREQSEKRGRVFNFKQTGSTMGHGIDTLDGRRHLDRPDPAAIEARRDEDDRDVRDLIGSVLAA